VAAVNYGILLFTHQQHAKALSVLEPVYGHVEAMHGGSAICLCAVLLEIYISSNQLGKAAQVIQYLQSSLVSRASDRAAATHHDDVSSRDHQAPIVQEQQQQQQHFSGPRSPAGSPRSKQTQAAGRDVQQAHQQQQQQHDGQQHQDFQFREQQHQQQHPAAAKRWETEEQWCCCSSSGVNLPIVSRCSSELMQQV
jgi:hypothetical protein